MTAEVFTTATLTRREAGFVNNTDISDALDIEPRVKSANGEISGCVGSRYVLPLSDNTNYSGSAAEGFLVDLATQLAASELFLQQYEGQGGDLVRAADSKIKLVREKLEKLKKGLITLVDTDGVELALKTAGLSAISGFPKNTDFDYPDEPTTVNPIVTMGEKF